MGIYIKNMEMPISCHECVAGYGGCCFVALAEADGICPDHGRADFCPLVPVPPHGRLIDADALEQDAQKRMLICDKNGNQFQKPYEVMRAISLAPTIVEEEEVEDD